MKNSSQITSSETQKFFVDGPRGELVVEATSKADAVYSYASECGYRTVGSPEFIGDAEVWVDRADGDAKYLVVTAEAAIERLLC